MRLAKGALDGVQAGRPLGHEALLPAPHSCLLHARLGHDRVGRNPVAAEQRDPGRQTCFCEHFGSATMALSRLRSLADSLNILTRCVSRAVSTAESFCQDPHVPLS